MPPDPLTGRLPAARYTPPIPYEIVGEYREAFRQRDGSEVTLVCQVDFDQRINLMRAMLADCYLEPTGLAFPNERFLVRRHLPEPNPFYPWMAAVEAEVIEPIGIPFRLPTGLMDYFTNTYPPTPLTKGQARVAVTFRAVPYEFRLSDGFADGDPDRELCRYVIRNPIPQAEATQIGGNTFSWANNPVDNPLQPIPEAGAKVLPTVELRYTWVMVPGLPRSLTNATELDTFLGRVNSHRFDTRSLLQLRDPMSGVPIGITPGTWLYLALEATDIYFTPGGTQVRDLTIIGSYRPTLWNRYYRRGTGFNLFQEVSVDGVVYGGIGPDGKQPYNSADMAALFKFL